MFPLLRAGTTELIFNRTTAPLSSSFTYFSDAKSASSLQWCNAESLAAIRARMVGREMWIWISLTAATATAHGSSMAAGGQGGTAKGRMSSEGGLEEVSTSAWFGSLPYSTRTAAISEAYLLRYLSFQLNNIQWKKPTVLCKSKGPYACKCTSRFKNGLSGISLYLDWFWWDFSYTTLCRDAISINKRPVQVSLSDIKLNVINQLQPKLHLTTSNSFWNKATDNKNPVRQNNSWPLSDNKFLILGENIQSYIRQVFFHQDFGRVIINLEHAEKEKFLCCFRELV